MGVSVEELDVDGAPQVGVTVTGLDPDNESVISVEVSWDGGDTWYGVRGAERVTVTGAAFFRDFVPPLNVVATYRVVLHQGADEPDPSQDTITVTSDRAWIQDPLDPRGAIPVVCDTTTGGISLQAESFSTFNREQFADRVAVEGSRYPVASVGARQAPSDVPLHLRAFAASQGALVRSLRVLFDQAGVLVLRGLPDGVPLDAVAHVTAGTVTEVPLVGGLMGVFNDWHLVVDQVRPTSMKVVVPWFTYDQVAALWQEWESGATYDDAVGTRPGDTYLDWQRDPQSP
jgi:hypothetical protein